MGQMPLLLFVDDDAQFLEILSVKLSSEGFRVETAQSGTEALEKARRTAPDLVVIDMKIPGMDGAEILHALRADAALRKLKVVFLSGIIAADEKQFRIDRSFAIAEGALGCIRKTDDLEHIVKAIKEFAGVPAAPGGASPAASNPNVLFNSITAVAHKPAPPVPDLSDGKASGRQAATGGFPPAHHG